MALTDVAVKKALPKEKRYMIADDRGLYLEVLPTGKKSWRLRYRHNDKEKKITIGIYPEFTLHEARVKMEEIKRRLAHGQSVKENVKRTFKLIAEEWLATRIIPIRAPSYVVALKKRLSKHIYPTLGGKTADEITPKDILEICRRAEALGTIETSHRIKQIAGQVIRYAIAIDEATTDPTYSLKGALRPKNVTHYATITEPEKIGLLMRNIAAYPMPLLRLAMQFSVLTLCRPGEVRHAEWSEIDWEKKVWQIPAERMKMRQSHIVPLSEQAFRLIEELKELTDWQKWLFPSARLDGRPMSENAVRVALRSMGYSNDEITPHGFRAMASTILNENELPPDVIERQLAHADKDPIRAAYNRARYLEKRRNVVQWWADWLDEQRSNR